MGIIIGGAVGGVGGAGIIGAGVFLFIQRSRAAAAAEEAERLDEERRQKKKKKKKDGRKSANGSNAPGPDHRGKSLSERSSKYAVGQEDNAPHSPPMHDNFAGAPMQQYDGGAAYAQQQYHHEQYNGAAYAQPQPQQYNPNSAAYAQGPLLPPLQPSRSGKLTGVMRSSRRSSNFVGGLPQPQAQQPGFYQPAHMQQQMQQGYY